MLAETLVIESGIPAPSQVGFRAIVAALRQLQVGQSVLVPGIKARQASNYTRPAKRGTTKFFECKSMTTGTRIWRLE